MLMFCILYFSFIKHQAFSTPKYLIEKPYWTSTTYVQIKSSEKDEILNISENVNEQLASDEKDLLQEISDCSLNEAHNNEQNIEEKLTKPCENVNANKNTFLEVANGKKEEKLVDINVNEKYFNEYDNVCDSGKNIIIDNDDGQNSVDDGEINVDKDENDDHNDDYYDDSDDEDDDGDWITPHNITQVKADFGAPEVETRPTNVVVGCLTTDFAMQVL